MADTRPVLFTLDVEDHLGNYASDGRYIANTLRVIEKLSELRIRGTLFFVGKAALQAPQLVKAAISAGHEIGCHSWQHRTLDRETPETFRAETAKAKAILEDMSGRPVIGYRAPVFSLVPSTTWAIEIIRELGFAYSSSVMPAFNPLHCFPGAPRTPFLWPNGLVELPCPVGSIGPINLPYLGGIYFRYLPLALSQALLRVETNPCPWTYCHPYDFDTDEPFTRMPNTGLATNILIWLRRRGALKKFLALMGDVSKTKPLAEWVESQGALPAFELS